MYNVLLYIKGIFEDYFSSDIFCQSFRCVGIVPLKIVKKHGYFSLSDILYVECTAGYDIYQIGASACEVPLTCSTICFSCYDAGYFPTPVQVWTGFIYLFMFAGILRFIIGSNLIKRDDRVQLFSLV